MQDQTTFQKRQVAYKINISTVLTSAFQRDELSAGYIQVGPEKISRVNIIGTVVHITEGNIPSASVDDGTGRISLRTFENTGIFSRFEVGDLVLVIGRVREYNNEKYVIPEAIRKLDNFDWIALRKIEVEKSGFSDVAQNSGEKEIPIEPKAPAGEIVYSMIKELDLGEGAAIEDVIEKSKDERAETIIARLLENGDIFELKPGKLKILE